MIWTARAILLFSVLHLLFLSPSTNAAVGAIAGRITDRQSGAVIEGATITVVVAGQVLSATSQFDGSFGLGSLELGHYDLSVQAGGYKPITLRDLVVESDKVTIREIALDSAPPSDKRPDSIETNEKKKASDDPQQHMAADSAVPVETRHYIDRDEMHHLPVRYPDEAVALQNGVATLIKSRIHFKQTHIRGGRLDNNSYLLNGVRITEATNGIFSATVSPYAVGSISFMPGNYSAEYGQANGGIISISMPSGGPRYSGTIESVSDNVGGSGFDQNWYTGTLSGPVPGLSNSTFFTSVERRYLGDERPSLVSKESLPGSPNRLPNNWRKGFSFAGRLDFQIRPKLQLSVTGNRSTDQWRQYIHSYLFNSEHMPYHSVENMVICAELSHEISSRTSYRLAASFAENERFRGDGLLREDLLAYNQPGGNPRFNTRTLFWDEGHVWDDYLHQKTSSKGLKGILTLTPGTHHQIKLGFDLMRHTVRSYQHFFPAKIGDPTDATDYDNYLDIDRFGYDSLGNESDGERMNGFLANRPKHPVDLAAFVQERFTWRALRVSLGIRLDRYDYDTRVVRSSARPLDPDTGQITKAFILNSSDLTDAESYTHLSPRLGLAISMGERGRIHFNAGKYVQRPALAFLYVGDAFFQHKVNLGGYFYSFGNGRLRPEKAEKYELGFSYELEKQGKLSINFFQHSLDDLPQEINQQAWPNSYTTFMSIGYSRTVGIELALSVKPTHALSLYTGYSLSWADGSGGGRPFSSRDIAWQGGNAPEITVPLDHDQRHKLVGNLDLHAGKVEGPHVGRFRPFENFRLNLLAIVESGYPYTPSKIFNEVTLGATAPTPSTRNSERTPWTVSIDLKAEKTVRFGAFQLTPFLWIKNLLDRKNVVSVYQGTGRANSTNWLSTEAGEAWANNTPYLDDSTGMTAREEYILKENAPLNYGLPRQVYFGIRATF